MLDQNIDTDCGEWELSPLIIFYSTICQNRLARGFRIYVDPNHLITVDRFPMLQNTAVGNVTAVPFASF